MSRTTGSVYVDYERLIAKVENWVASYDPQVSGCNSADARARIVQRIVQLTADEFSARATRTRTNVSGVAFRGGGITISDTGRVSVSGKLWLISVAYFLASWLEVAVEFLRRRGREGGRSGRSTILTEAGGGYEEDDAAFVAFCLTGPIEPLRTATQIVVQTTRVPARANVSTIVYAPVAVARVVGGIVGRRDRWAAAVAHGCAPFRYVAALVRCPLAVLVSRDLALVPVVGWLDRTGLIEAVVTTTSAFPAQFLWMKGLAGQRFRLHMLWYSQNFLPKMYRGESSHSNLPAARHIRADVHWVWTEGFKAYLQNLLSAPRVEVVGPILWYLPPIVHSAERDGSVKIAVFDITPLPDGETAFGAAKNYYSVTTISRFVTDIIETAETLAAETGRQFQVLIKHKRTPKVGYHDPSYLDMLESLERDKPYVTLIDHRTNLYGLLADCDLSISVPWTSTAYVGAYLRKPSIYYDPFEELVATHEPDPHVHFAAGPDALRLVVRDCVQREMAPR